MFYSKKLCTSAPVHGCPSSRPREPPVPPAWPQLLPERGGRRVPSPHRPLRLWGAVPSPLSSHSPPRPLPRPRGHQGTRGGVARSRTNVFLLAKQEQHTRVHTRTQAHAHIRTRTHTHAQVRALMDSAVTSGARFASQMAGEPKAWPSPEERMLLRRGLQVASPVQHPTPSRHLNPKGRCGVSSAHRGAVKGGRF